MNLVHVRSQSFSLGHGHGQEGSEEEGGEAPKGVQAIIYSVKGDMGPQAKDPNGEQQNDAKRSPQSRISTAPGGFRRKQRAETSNSQRKKKSKGEGERKGEVKLDMSGTL